MQTSPLAYQPYADPVPSPDSAFVPARKVWERYGVTAMTLYRWLRDERMNFPQPTYLGRFRYWRLSDLQAWERSRSSKTEAA